jgi:CelD/BcsL family acetyltransferase involved in cellulose biosynthesis
MPIETPDLHESADAAATVAGRAMADATTASAATDVAVAISPTRFNIQFPPIGLPT